MEAYHAWVRAQLMDAWIPALVALLTSAKLPLVKRTKGEVPMQQVLTPELTSCF
jgi:hypothetical protein